MELVDVSLFKLVTNNSLESLLDNIIGPKTLVLDSTLAGQLGLITQIKLLKVSQPSHMLNQS